MNRRRLCWLCSLLFVLGIGIGVAAAWFALGRRDADFHVIGPKTNGTRANFARLDSTIDAAEFRNCQTVADVLQRLHTKLQRQNLSIQNGQLAVALEFDWFGTTVRVDEIAFARERIDRSIGDRRVRFAADHQPMTVKQLLRETFRQAEVPDVHFIVRGHYIEATTLAHVNEERDRYLAGVTLYDRVRQMWKEINGELEEDPFIFVID